MNTQPLGWLSAEELRAVLSVDDQRSRGLFYPAPAPVLPEIEEDSSDAAGEEPGEAVEAVGQEAQPPKKAPAKSVAEEGGSQEEAARRPRTSASAAGGAAQSPAAPGFFTGRARPPVYSMAVVVEGEPVALVFRSMSRALKVKSALATLFPLSRMAELDDSDLRAYTRVVASHMVQMPLFVEQRIGFHDSSVLVPPNSTYRIPFGSAAPLGDGEGSGAQGQEGQEGRGRQGDREGRECQEDREGQERRAAQRALERAVGLPAEWDVDQDGVAGDSGESAGRASEDGRQRDQAGVYSPLADAAAAKASAPISDVLAALELGGSDASVPRGMGAAGEPREAGGAAETRGTGSDGVAEVRAVKEELDLGPDASPSAVPGEPVGESVGASVQEPAEASVALAASAAQQSLDLAARSSQAAVAPSKVASGQAAGASAKPADTSCVLGAGSAEQPIQGAPDSLPQQEDALIGEDAVDAPGVSSEPGELAELAEAAEMAEPAMIPPSHSPPHSFPCPSLYHEHELNQLSSAEVTLESLTRTLGVPFARDTSQLSELTITLYNVLCAELGEAGWILENLPYCLPDRQTDQIYLNLAQYLLYCAVPVAPSGRALCNLPAELRPRGERLCRLALVEEVRRTGLSEQQILERHQQQVFPLLQNWMRGLSLGQKRHSLLGGDVSREGPSCLCKDILPSSFTAISSPESIISATPELLRQRDAEGWKPGELVSRVVSFWAIQLARTAKATQGVGNVEGMQAVQAMQAVEAAQPAQVSQTPRTPQPTNPAGLLDSAKNAAEGATAALDDRAADPPLLPDEMLRPASTSSTAGQAMISRYIAQAPRILRDPEMVRRLDPLFYHSKTAWTDAERLHLCLTVAEKLQDALDIAGSVAPWGELAAQVAARNKQAEGPSQIGGSAATPAAAWWAEQNKAFRMARMAFQGGVVPPDGNVGPLGSLDMSAGLSVEVEPANLDGRGGNGGSGVRRGKTGLGGKDTRGFDVSWAGQALQGPTEQQLQRSRQKGQSRQVHDVQYSQDAQQVWQQSQQSQQNQENASAAPAIFSDLMLSPPRSSWAPQAFQIPQIAQFPAISQPALHPQPHSPPSSSSLPPQLSSSGAEGPQAKRAASSQAGGARDMGLIESVRLLLFFCSCGKSLRDLRAANLPLDYEAVRRQLFPHISPSSFAASAEEILRKFDGFCSTRRISAVTRGESSIVLAPRVGYGGQDFTVPVRKYLQALHSWNDHLEGLLEQNWHQEVVARASSLPIVVLDSSEFVSMLPDEVISGVDSSVVQDAVREYSLFHGSVTREELVVAAQRVMQTYEAAEAAAAATVAGADRGPVYGREREREREEAFIGKGKEAHRAKPRRND